MSMRRRSWWGATLVVLLGGALTAGGMARAQDVGGAHEHGHREHIKKVLDAAGATPAQRAQIQAVWAEIRPQLHTLRQQHAQVRAQMKQAFAAPTLDPQAIEALRKQSVQVMDQISSLMTQGFLKSAQVLTPDQRQKAAQAFGDEVHAP